MSLLFGSEISTVDAKGRMNVPARLRKGLSPEAADSFTIVRGPEGCVKMYPLDEWRRYAELLVTFSTGDDQSRAFFRLLSDTAHETTIDGQGRVTLTQRLLELAGVDGQAKLVGQFDHIEVWNPKRFAEGVGAEDSKTKFDAQFNRMTQEVQRRKSKE
jgi:MraZ protein